MPRYQLIQSDEVAGKDSEGGNREPVIHWDEEHDSDIAAERRALEALPQGYWCRLGWSGGSIDAYDASRHVQRNNPTAARHIATLKRVA